MNILVFIKEKSNRTEEKLEVIDHKNNKIFFLNKSIIFKISDVLKLIKKEKIDVVLSLGNHNIFLKIIEFLYKCPVVLRDEIDKEENLEKLLQHKIAYKHQKDLPVLMYHRVVDDEKYAGVYDTHVTLENFEKQMKYIKDNGYETITFEDIANEEYKNRFNNKKYVIITFDDGYKDNLKNALPILKKYNLKAVLFYVTDETYNRWDTDAENRPKEKKFELMNLEEIKELYSSGLIEIGGHTTTHLDMPLIEKEKLKKDLEESRDKIEKITGKKPVSFAYPWGRNNETCRKIVEEVGYKFAVSTESGSSCFSDDLFEIVRVGIYSKDDIKKFEQKISGNYPFMRENRAKMKKIRNKLRKMIGLKTK